MEPLAPTGQYLVSVGLMADVPHDTVFRGVEHIVKCYCEFHYAKTAGKVTWIPAEFPYQVLAQLVAYLRQLVLRQFA